MTRIAVVYDSSTGHDHAIGQAVAAGADGVGAEVLAAAGVQGQRIARFAAALAGLRGAPD
ncbi:hypothetical protein [Pseudooceanicola pacificus]|uniref:hypothetical protein n=1 Tax=Pseudooceanicola pacificus TaxID=2676438 RepID=UPI0013663030|nr:hypothetical protein [Pseudooceanicola pacificus]